MGQEIKQKEIDRTIRKYLLVNPLKKLGKTILWIVAVIFLIWFCYIWFIGAYIVPDYGGIVLARMVNSVVGTSYKQSLEFKNNDIAKITTEVLGNIQCVHTKGKLKGMVSLKADIDKSKHTECLKINVVNPEGQLNGDINDILCSHPLTCNLYSLAIGDYALQSPEILWNIIKVAERPCDYIKKVEDITEDEVILEEQIGLRDGYSNKKVIMEITNANDSLTCNAGFLKKLIASKKFIQVVVKSSKDDAVMRILVRRKDI
ncbi:hypothetical protein [Rickettsia endosymbiont of Culicoides newsteadi]|uniref:hypothetical protein n=1 Tax=Rickettsia endosymbiont of Culicoides newsteadi TaxID=1961830 RepID=UPI000B9B88F7|nr:hypothetical protein [Rickettsia endosymbiont of Culicoides newsteadi]OZG32418.1 hypothetical protein RiCNE_01470 [Rickettsia endosymbiont of Culicoides newsteadi]